MTRVSLLERIPRVRASLIETSVASEPVVTSVGPIQVTISLGVTSPKPEQLGTSIELLKEADERLYEAKQAGRNRTVC